jgi:hypothetical protein
VNITLPERRVVCVCGPSRLPGRVYNILWYRIKMQRGEQNLRGASSYGVTQQEEVLTCRRCADRHMTN